jgi:hypothetical protein
MLCWQCATVVKVAPALSKIMAMPSTQATGPFGAVRITFFFFSKSDRNLLQVLLAIKAKLWNSGPFWLAWARNTYTEAMYLVSILVSQSADSVYCVLPIVDLGPAEIFSW